MFCEQGQCFAHCVTRTALIAQPLGIRMLWNLIGVGVRMKCSSCKSRYMVGSERRPRGTNGCQQPKLWSPIASDRLGLRSGFFPFCLREGYIAAAVLSQHPSPWPVSQPCYIEPDILQYHLHHFLVRGFAALIQKLLGS